MSREDRRLLNIKQNSINDINYYPSGKSVPEGDILISHPRGKPLRLYKKLKGMLWWIDFTRDGNQYVDKDLKVNGDIKCGGTFKSSDNTEGLTDTIAFNDGDGATHGVTIKDGLITSWNIS
jgi:hypothetical protein